MTSQPPTTGRPEVGPKNLLVRTRTTYKDYGGQYKNPGHEGSTFLFKSFGDLRSLVDGPLTLGSISILGVAEGRLYYFNEEDK